MTTRFATLLPCDDATTSDSGTLSRLATRSPSLVTRTRSSGVDGNTKICVVAWLNELALPLPAKVNPAGSRRLHADSTRPEVPTPFWITIVGRFDTSSAGNDLPSCDATRLFSPTGSTRYDGGPPPLSIG